MLKVVSELFKKLLHLDLSDQVLALDLLLFGFDIIIDNLLSLDFEFLPLCLLAYQLSAGKVLVLFVQGEGLLLSHLHR